LPPRKKAEPSTDPNAVVIEITKDDVYYAFIVGAQPMRFTFCSNVNEIRDRVEAMLGMAGYMGVVNVEWVGGDEAGKKAAKRLSSHTKTDSP